MFSDIAVAKRTERQKQANGSGQNGENQQSAGQTVDLNDTFDDSEGYYRLRIGELLDKRYIEIIFYFLVKFKPDVQGRCLQNRWPRFLLSLCLISDVIAIDFHINKQFKVIHILMVPLISRSYAKELCIRCFFFPIFLTSNKNCKCSGILAYEGPISCNLNFRVERNWTGFLKDSMIVV